MSVSNYSRTWPKVLIILACAPMTENITQMFKYICVEGEEKL